MNICGIPIKQLNLVEDRSDYYKHRHHAAQSALVQALQTLALLEPAGGAPPLAVPQAPAPAPAVDLSELAALLSLQESAAAAQARPQVTAAPAHCSRRGLACAARRPLDAGSPCTSASCLPSPPQPYPMHQPWLPYRHERLCCPPGGRPALPRHQRRPALCRPARLQPGRTCPPPRPPTCTACRRSPRSRPRRPPRWPPHWPAPWAPPTGAPPPAPAALSARWMRRATPLQLLAPNKDLAAAFPLAASHHSTASGSSGSASPDLGAAAANRLVHVAAAERADGGGRRRRLGRAAAQARGAARRHQLGAARAQWRRARLRRQRRRPPPPPPHPCPLPSARWTVPSISCPVLWGRAGLQTRPRPSINAPLPQAP